MQNEGEYDRYRDSVEDLKYIIKLNILIISGFFTGTAVILRSDIGISFENIFTNMIIAFGLTCWLTSMISTGITYILTRPEHLVSETTFEDEFLVKGGVITSAKQLHNYASNIIFFSIASISLFFFGMVGVAFEEFTDLTNSTNIIIFLILVLMLIVLSIYPFGKYAPVPLTISAMIRAILQHFISIVSVDPSDAHKFYSNLNPGDGEILKEIHEHEGNHLEIEQLDTLSEYSMRRRARIMKKLSDSGYIYKNEHGEYRLMPIGEGIAKGKLMMWARIRTYTVSIFN